MRGIRELLRKDITPINVVPGDAVELLYSEPGQRRRVVAHVAIDNPYTFTEAVVFEAEPGVLGEGRALGGAFVE